jgi:hypothetical protein
MQSVWYFPIYVYTFSVLLRVDSMYVLLIHPQMFAALLVGTDTVVSNWEHDSSRDKSNGVSQADHNLSLLSHQYHVSSLARNPIIVYLTVSVDQVPSTPSLLMCKQCSRRLGR